jgi:hypothetical protein
LHQNNIHSGGDKAEESDFLSAVYSEREEIGSGCEEEIYYHKEPYEIVVMVMGLVVRVVD